jgi:basic amino acid/polyamine antiporter, APA family
MIEEEKPSEFRRTLGLLDATLLVSGSMIGSGIFIVTADMTRMVGSSGWMLAMWVLTGVITIFAALSYGELAGMMPKAGGQFVYIQRAFGNLMAFLFGWTVFAVIQTGLIAAVAVAFAKYAGYFFPAVSQSNILFNLGFLQVSGAQVLAMVVIFFLTLVNSGGIQNGKIILLVFTLAKILALFGLIILGLFFAKHSYLSQNFENAWAAKQYTKAADGTITTQVLSGITLLLAFGTAIIGPVFSSDAWYNVTFIAGEIKNPKRNIPLSLMLGTVLVTIIYILANLAYLNLLPLQDIMFAESDRVGTAAASQLFGVSAASIMAGLIMVSTFGCISGLILSGARVYYAMSKEGLFFEKAGTLNKNDVPGWALWAQCIWASLLCLSGTYGDLLDYLVFGTLIFLAVTTMSVIVLRKKDPNAERPYKVPFYPFTPIIYVIIASVICLILLYTKTENAGRGLLLILAGLPLYFYFKKK